MHSVCCAMIGEILLRGKCGLHHEGPCQPVQSLDFILRAVRILKRDFSRRVTHSDLCSRKTPVVSVGGNIVEGDVPVRRLL